MPIRRQHRWPYPINRHKLGALHQEFDLRRHARMFVDQSHHRRRLPRHWLDLARQRARHWHVARHPRRLEHADKHKLRALQGRKAAFAFRPARRSWKRSFAGMTVLKTVTLFAARGSSSRHPP